MTNKKDTKEDENDLSGFQEFLDAQKEDAPFLPRGVGGGSRKQEHNFINITFLTNDRNRLMRLKNLLGEKVNFMAKFDHSEKLISEQASELDELREMIFEISDEAGSQYRKSLSEIFNSFFKTSNWPRY